MNQKRLSRAVGLILYTLGLLVGATFILFSVWGDFESNAFWGTREAAMYNAAQKINARLTGIQCPIFINSDDTAELSTMVVNRSDEPNELLFQISVSDPAFGSESRNEYYEIELAPHERRAFTWTISDADKVYDRSVLVRTYLYEKEIFGPAKTKNCGILVTDLLGLSSTLLIVVSISVSILFMGLGFWLWYRVNRPLKRKTSQFAFALSLMYGLVILGSITCLLDLYIISMGVGIIMIISMYSMVEILSY